MAGLCIRCSANLPERARFCPECAFEQAQGHAALGPTLPSIPPPTPPTFHAPAAKGSKSDSPAMLDGAPVKLSHILPAGTLISGVYVVDSLIGTGGMGAVYRAHDRARQRDVALKIIHPNLASDAEVRRRFAREARLMRSLVHPNVVSVYDFIQDERFLAIVMENVEGPTLAQEIRRWNGQMPFAQIRSVMSAILDAISEAHKNGIVHRDIKPDNVLLRMDRKEPVPKVVDFGVAKILEGTVYTVTGGILGTCRYMAPEQVEKPDHLSYPADVYSLGVTLFEMITGRVPFEHDSHFALMMAHVRDQPPSPGSLRADVPRALCDLIAQALSKKPEQRQRDCGEVAAQLRAALAHIDSAPAEVRDTPAVVRDADGGELVLIPEGFFSMGQERRKVHLDPFYIDRLPVTNRQFVKFLEVTGHRPSHSDYYLQFPERLRSHPAVHVSWFDACAYAQWAGKSLPSEAQWEKAARGTDGRNYPWGKSAPDSTRANYGLTRRGTVPVGSYPAGASPYGIQDMAGNVWEWCLDADAPDFYAHGPSHNPCNHGTGKERRVVRGGAFLYDAHSVRTFSRSSFEPSVHSQAIGFRCVRRI
jgi:eukaryotic-like serine/threonine-protein kinase